MKRNQQSPVRTRSTQERVAELAGTSRSAVAHALNPRLCHCISPELRGKIEEVNHQIGYRPSRTAQLLRGGRSGMVGIVAPFGLLQANAARVYHLSQALRERGWRVVVETVSILKETEHAFLSFIDAHAEGVFVLASLTGHVDRSQLQSLAAQDIPCIRFTGGPIPGFPVIRANIREGMNLLVEHLVQVGHRRLCFVRSPTPPNPDPGIFWPSLERTAGFTEAVQSAQGKVIEGTWLTRPPISSSKIVGEILFYNGELPWDDPQYPGREAVNALLKRGPLPDVLLMSNDDWALGALGAAVANGLNVPADFAVTGFDATTASRFSFPPLTTVAQPIADQARIAVQLFEKLLRKEKLSPAEEFVLLPCSLAKSQSCGGSLRQTSP